MDNSTALDLIVVLWFGLVSLWIDMVFLLVQTAVSNIAAIDWCIFRALHFLKKEREYFQQELSKFAVHQWTQVRA